MVYEQVWKKSFFFAPGTLVDPPLAHTKCGPGCPPAPPSDHWCGGLGVLLGESKGWMPHPSFDRFEWVSGPFRAKKGCIRTHNAQFREGTSGLGTLTPGTTGELVAQNLDSARAPPRF